MRRLTRSAGTRDWQAVIVIAGLALALVLSLANALLAVAAALTRWLWPRLP